MKPKLHASFNALSRSAPAPFAAARRLLRGRLLGSPDIEHYKAGKEIPASNGNIVMISAAGAENIAAELEDHKVPFFIFAPSRVGRDCWAATGDHGTWTWWCRRWRTCWPILAREDSRPTAVRAALAFAG